MCHIALHAGQRRSSARNNNTLGPTPGRWPQLWRPSTSFEELFLKNYQHIRQVCRGFGQLGVAVVAIDRERGTMAGSACLAARMDAPSVAIVGRHGLADLYLDGDGALSLRHLAVVLHPLKSWDPQRLMISLLDLRTPQQFKSEYGDVLAGLVAEGPVFVNCERYAIFCLVAGDDSDWPLHAEDAWAMIPERQYVDVQKAADRSPRALAHVPEQRGASPGRRPRSSRITLIDGPEMADALLLAAGEPIAGYLTAASSGRSRTVPVGASALERGVLVGRNPRCDQHDLLSDTHISRVHLMLRRIGGATYAFDIASTGRTFSPLGGQLLPIRLIAVPGALDFSLASGRARVRWQPII